VIDGNSVGVAFDGGGRRRRRKGRKRRELAGLVLVIHCINGARMVELS